MFFFACSINQFSKMLEKLTRKQIMPIIQLFIFIFHAGNRVHFAQIGEGLVKIALPCDKGSVWYLLSAYIKSQKTG